MSAMGRTAGPAQQQHQQAPFQHHLTATERFYGQHTPRRRRETSASISSTAFPTPPRTNSPRHRKGTNPEGVPVKELAPNVSSLEKLRLTTQAFTRMHETMNSMNPHTSTRGGSGQQFTVASVGNNGMLYLRPVTRRIPDTFVALPSTPPRTAERKGTEVEEEEEEHVEKDRPRRPPPKSRLPAPKTPPHSPRKQAPNQTAPSSPPIAKTQHYQRARSYSTAGHQRLQGSPEANAGNIRIVIERAETIQRPKTAGPEEKPHEPQLDIKIPNYNLGSPSFSPSGTPFIFGTSLPPPSVEAEDGQNSYAGSETRESQWVWPLVESPSRGDKIMRPSLLSSRLTSEVSSLIVASVPIMNGGHQPIIPAIYDRLSFAPFCDDPAIVKFHPKTKEITAATPPRIIAQITSATFLDYQLLSDFFLTFRAFMTPSDLVAHLLARLRWAIERDDDIGRVVRVRTFVAIRHWLLNYFADDFLPSLDLREQFSGGLNDLTDDIRASERPDHSDMKIIGELKKCWRKTCALYWNPAPGRHPEVEVGIEKDILPGGRIGSREDPKALAEAVHDEQLSSARKGKSKEVPRLRQKPTSTLASGATERFIKEMVNAGRDGANSTVADPLPDGHRRSAKARKPKKQDQESGTLTGQVKSTSLPSFSPRSTVHENVLPQLATPRVPSLPSTTTATNIKSLLSHSSSRSKSARDPHKRNASFSDSLRNKHQLDIYNQPFAKLSNMQLSFPYSGSLVRGNLIPPTPATVEVIAPSTPAARSLLDAPVTIRGHKVHNHRIAALTRPGVKKLFDNMKRALSSRVPHLQNTCATDGDRGTPEALARYVATKGKNATLTGILSRTTSFASNIGGDVTRIDLLGAGVVEAFHRALEDDVRALTDVNAGDRRYSSESQDTIRQSIISPRFSRAENNFRSGQNEDGNADSGDSDNEPSKHNSLSPTPLRRLGIKRAVSAGFAIESGSIRGRKQGSFGRVALDTWATSGVVTPSPSASLSSTRRSHSFSYEPTLDLYKTEFHAGLQRRLGDGLAGLASPSSGSDEKSYLSFNSTNLLPLARSEAMSSPPIDEAFEDDDMSPPCSSPMTKSATEPFSRPPARMLRRRPGGDLKAVNTIADMVPDLRPQSAGTLGTFDTYTDSTLSIWPRKNQSLLYSQPNLQNGVLSLSAVTRGGHALVRGASVRRQSLLNRMSTVSTKSVPETFEAGVLKLAELPDTASDDGGVDVALAKLEGTYHRRSLTEPVNGWRASRDLYHPTPRHSNVHIVVQEEEIFDSDDDAELEHDNDHGEDKKRRRQQQVVDPAHLEDAFSNTTKLTVRGLHPMSAIAGLDLRAINESRDCVPILERGQSTNAISDMGSSDRALAHTTISLQDIEQDLLAGRDVPIELVEASSYYQTTRDSLSSVSSNISLDAIQISYKRASTSSSALPDANSGTMSDFSIPAHPLHHPPSPPLSSTTQLSASPESENFHPVANGAVSAVTPPQEKPHGKVPRRLKSQKKIKKANAATDTPMAIHVTSIHLPFILAYDSELLAKQFTIIEKDALSEIDWKELVELRWKQTTTPVRDWVEFLAAGDIHGVEVVIARFNLVCKWVMSEIVMTRNTQERSRCVVKFIHIAAHARRLQNFATMYQITVALLSADVTRLRRTWAMVSPADMSTLKELESLVQPIRNFHNLRMEMETVTGETGCIPFVGLYTHDLIYNAQRPSQIASTPTTQPLVNFERHRMTAMVVKRLLRLVEASQKYEFKPVDGVCERCLWIATLKDDELRQLSYELETD